MIKFRTMIPLAAAFTISAAAMQSCDTIRPIQEGETELVKSPNQDTFEKKAEGKLNIPFATETILGTLGLVAFICGLYYLKNPTEAKKHLFGEKESNENAVDKQNPVE